MAKDEEKVLESNQEAPPTPSEQLSTEKLLERTGVIGARDSISRRNFDVVAGFVSRDAPLTMESAQAFKESVEADHRQDMTIMQVAWARRESARLVRYLTMLESYEDAAMDPGKVKDAPLSELFRGLEYLQKRTDTIRKSMGDLSKLPPININIETIINDNRSVNQNLDLSDPTERETIRRFFGELKPALQELADAALKEADTLEAKTSTNGNSIEYTVVVNEPTNGNGKKPDEN